jgi:hypothetical protein
MPFYLPIPRGTHHVAKATATVPRFVKCEECGHGYGYWLTRTGYGHAYEHWGFIPSERLDRFVTDAEVEAEQKLKTACEAVPCPECGWYQRHMRDRAREERYGWLLWAGIGAAIVGVFLLMSLGGMAAMVVEKYLHNGAIVLVMRVFPFLALPLAVLMPVGACLLRNYLSARYDPNDEDVEERKQLGWDRAMSPKEYARLTKGKRAKGTHHKLRPEDLA